MNLSLLWVAWLCSACGCLAAGIRFTNRQAREAREAFALRLPCGRCGETIEGTELDCGRCGRRVRQVEPGERSVPDVS